MFTSLLYCFRLVITTNMCVYYFCYSSSVIYLFLIIQMTEPTTSLT